MDSLKGRHNFKKCFPSEASVDEDQAPEIGKQIDVCKIDDLVSANHFDLL